MRFHLIKRKSSQEAPKKNRHLKKLVYGGYDPARQVDRSAFILLERMDDDILEIRLAINLQGAGYIEQVREITSICKTRGLMRLAIDGTNNLHLVENLQAVFPGKILDVHFTRAVKEQLINDLRIAFQEKKIRLNRKLKHHRLIVRELNELDPKKLDHPPKGSSDFCWSLALAYHASKFKWQPIRKGYLNLTER